MLTLDQTTSTENLPNQAEEGELEAEGFPRLGKEEVGIGGKEEERFGSRGVMVQGKKSEVGEVVEYEEDEEDEEETPQALNKEIYLRQQIARGRSTRPKQASTLHCLKRRAREMRRRMDETAHWKRMDQEVHVQVLVKKPGGGYVCIDTNLNSTVKELKAAIGGKVKILTEDMRLKFEAKQLEDHHPLAAYNITANSTIEILSRLRGGGNRPASSIPVDYNSSSVIDLECLRGTLETVLNLSELRREIEVAVRSIKHTLHPAPFCTRTLQETLDPLLYCDARDLLSFVGSRVTSTVSTSEANGIVTVHISSPPRLVDACVLMAATHLRTLRTAGSTSLAVLAFTAPMDACPIIVPGLTSSSLGTSFLPQDPTTYLGRGNSGGNSGVAQPSMGSTPIPAPAPTSTLKQREKPPPPNSSSLPLATRLQGSRKEKTSTTKRNSSTPKKRKAESRIDLGSSSEEGASATQVWLWIKADAVFRAEPLAAAFKSRRREKTGASSSPATTMRLPKKSARQIPVKRQRRKSRFSEDMLRKPFFDAVRAADADAVTDSSRLSTKEAELAAVAGANFIYSHLRRKDLQFQRPPEGRSHAGPPEEGILGKLRVDMSIPSASSSNHIAIDKFKDLSPDKIPDMLLKVAPEYAGGVHHHFTYSPLALRPEYQAQGTFTRTGPYVTTPSSLDLFGINMARADEVYLDLPYQCDVAGDMIASSLAVDQWSKRPHAQITINAAHKERHVARGYAESANAKMASANSDMGVNATSANPSRSGYGRGRYEDGPHQGKMKGDVSVEFGAFHLLTYDSVLLAQLAHRMDGQCRALEQDGLIGTETVTSTFHQDKWPQFSLGTTNGALKKRKNSDPKKVTASAKKLQFFSGNRQCGFSAPLLPAEAVGRNLPFSSAAIRSGRAPLPPTTSSVAEAIQLFQPPPCPPILSISLPSLDDPTKPHYEVNIRWTHAPSGLDWSTRLDDLTGYDPEQSVWTEAAHDYLHAYGKWAMEYVKKYSMWQQDGGELVVGEEGRELVGDGSERNEQA
ncbi:hypothetical protein JCM11641_000052 [Rhodosporidiobolus odoratus]